MSKLLSKQIVETLKDKIISGEYPEGSQLPNEQELVNMLDVSRSTIREAVKILESKKVVSIKRGIGTYVENFPGLSDDPLGLEFIPELTKVLDLLEMRLCIEPAIGKLACEKATDEDINKLIEIVEIAENLKKENKEKLSDEKVDKLEELDLSFHSQIYAMTHNMAFLRMFPLIKESLAYSYSQKAYREIQRTANTNVARHKDIALAIKIRNAELTEKLCTEHMKKAINDVKALL